MQINTAKDIGDEIYGVSKMRGQDYEVIGPFIISSIRIKADRDGADIVYHTAFYGMSFRGGMAFDHKVSASVMADSLNKGNL